MVNRLMGVESFTDSITLAGGANITGPLTVSGSLTASGGTVAGGASGAGSTFLPAGNLYRRILTVANGINPSATAADKIVDGFTLPANAFNATGVGMLITIYGTFAANANGKTIKVWFGATNTSPPLDGSTTVTGGTTFLTTGSITVATGGGFLVQGQLFKTGAANSNTQESMLTAAVFAATPAALGSWADQTALTENASSLIVVTVNCATTATDVKYQGMEAAWYN
jgi:hypothetical protein